VCPERIHDPKLQSGQSGKGHAALLLTSVYLLQTYVIWQALPGPLLPASVWPADSDSRPLLTEVATSRGCRDTVASRRTRHRNILAPACVLGQGDAHAEIGRRRVAVVLSAGCVSGCEPISATASGGIGDINVSGLEKRNGRWINPRSESAPVTIELDVHGGVGEIRIVAE